MAKPEDWAETLDELARRRGVSRAMGGDERLAKHHGKGKLDARETPRRRASSSSVSAQSSGLAMR